MYNDRPKSVSVNKRSISYRLNTRFLLLKERKRRTLTMKCRRKDRLKRKLPITLIALVCWELVLFGNALANSMSPYVNVKQGETSCKTFELNRGECLVN